MSSVGIYAVMGSIFFIVMAVLCVYAVYILLDITRQIRSLTARVSALTEKVQGIAERVDGVTSELGVRASGLARMVDETASSAMRVVDFVAPVLILVGAVSRIRAWTRGRRR